LQLTLIRRRVGQANHSEKDTENAVRRLFKIKPGLTAGSPEIVEKSRKWWDQGGKPAGLKTVGVFGCLGTDTRDVLIFEAQNHDDIREMVNFWRDTTDFEVHPAVDLAATFKHQGMKVT